MDKELRLPFSCAIQSPDRRFLVFCAGKFLQPIDLTTLQFVGVTQLKNEAHDGLIKNIAFNRCGTFLISCGDDKLIKAWDINSWICCRQVKVMKKVTSLLVTNDEMVVYADKFGHVYKFELEPFLSGSRYLKAEEHIFVMGHCSTITDMTLSPDERYLITADRDERVRVSHWPNAYNIHTFCLGHTEFVSKVIAVQRSELGLSGDGIVVFSGSGDGTVRVWDGETGICLATTHFPSSNRVVVISSMVWLSSQKIIAASAADEWKVAFWNVQKNEENKIILTLLHVLSTLSQPCSLFPHTDGSLWKLGPPPLVEVFFPTASHSKQDSEQQLVSFINSFGSFSVDNSTFNSTLESLNVLHYKKGLFNKSQNQKKQRVDS